eukprot:770869-Prymnesium_polylepis.1
MPHNTLLPASWCRSVGRPGAALNRAGGGAGRRHPAQFADPMPHGVRARRGADGGKTHAYARLDPLEARRRSARTRRCNRLRIRAPPF